MANGDTPKNPVMRSTDGVSICTYVDSRIGEVLRLDEARDKRLDERYLAQQQASELARQIMTAWQNGANEWRQQSLDRENAHREDIIRREITLLPKSEYSLQHGFLMGRLDVLERAKAYAEGKASTAKWLAIVSTLVTIGTLVGRIFKVL